MSGTGVQVRLDVDSSERLLIAHSYQDVEDIIERNKALKSMPQKSNWGRHVATIPNNILVIWLNEEHARGNTLLQLYTPEFDALVQRKLADPDWIYLRTDK